MAAGLRRWVAELRAMSSPRDVDAALAAIRVEVIEGDVALVRRDGEGDGDALSVLADGSVSVVRVLPDVYARVPTAEARVRLLRAASTAARQRVEVHVVVSADHSHVGRLAIDAPRRLLRAVGVPAAEPGDRFGPDRYAHCFFDEETLIDEARRAGLVLAARHGFVFTLRREAADERASKHPEHQPERDHEHAEPFATELARVVRRVVEVEQLRTHDTPERVVGELRARGSKGKERGPIGRARLRRAIGWVDAALPGGANCYRRVLLELALDAGAARETVVFGLDVGSTGHVAFEHREERAFDVAFAIPARPRE